VTNDSPIINYRGFSNPSKKFTLKRVIDAHNLDVILLQEIISKGGRMVSNLEKYLRGSDFTFIYSRDRSKGLVTRWIKKTLNSSNFLSFYFGLGIVLFS
jgi:hypothetical protein